MFDDPKAGALLYALDSSIPRIQGHEGESVEFTLEEFSAAFDERSDGNEKAELIRIHFDSLLYYFDRMEHSIQTGLTRFKDIITPTEYYISVMAHHREEMEAYIERVKYKRVLQFLNRFSNWRNKGERRR